MIARLLERWRRFRCKHRDYRYRTERRQIGRLFPEIGCIRYCATCGKILSECWGVDWEQIEKDRR